jgi:hypothetical protein
MRAEYTTNTGNLGFYGSDGSDGDGTTFNSGPSTQNAKRDFNILSMRTKNNDDYNIELDEDLFVGYDERNKYVV